MTEEEKRNVPPWLKKTLAVDAYLSDVFVRSVETFLTMRQLKTHYRALEISCHGIPWFALSLISIWIFHSSNLYQMQVNLLLGLTLDVFFVAIIKALVRRRRPIANDDPFGIGPDKFSFPSGHASRAAFIVYFYLNLWPVSLILIPPLIAWSTSVCLSRILMRKHHILDVLAGILLGIFEAMLVGYMFLTPETCVNFISWITGESVIETE